MLVYSYPNYVFVADTTEMTLCWMKSLAALIRCNQFNFNRVLLVPVSLTSYYCDMCFSTTAKLTVPFTVTVCRSTGKKLLRPLHSVLEHEHWHEQCTFSSGTLLTRTIHSSSCLYLAANWMTSSRLSKFCHHTIDTTLQSSLNRCSTTLKHVHNSRTIGLSQSSTSKNNQKWSISGVVRQLVCNYSDFIFCLL